MKDAIYVNFKKYIKKKEFSDDKKKLQYMNEGKSKRYTFFNHFHKKNSI
jgi:hypothetical protein